MPVQVSYPGVYIQEIPSGVRTITGVPTANTAFVGRALLGPVNQAMTLSSLGDYQRAFGGVSTTFPVSQSVSDFYQNGGSTSIVVRLFNPDPSQHPVDLANATAAATAVQEAGAAALGGTGTSNAVWTAAVAAATTAAAQYPAAGPENTAAQNVLTVLKGFNPTDSTTAMTSAATTASAAVKAGADAVQTALTNLATSNASALQPQALQAALAAAKTITTQPAAMAASQLVLVVASLPAANTIAQVNTAVGTQYTALVTTGAAAVATAATGATADAIRDAAIAAVPASGLANLGGQAVADALIKLDLPQATMSSMFGTEVINSAAQAAAPQVTATLVLGGNVPVSTVITAGNLVASAAGRAYAAGGTSAAVVTAAQSAAASLQTAGALASAAAAAVALAALMAQSVAQGAGSPPTDAAIALMVVQAAVNAVTTAVQTQLALDAQSEPVVDTASAQSVLNAAWAAAPNGALAVQAAVNAISPAPTGAGATLATALNATVAAQPTTDAGVLCQAASDGAAAAVAATLPSLTLNAASPGDWPNGVLSATVDYADITEEAVASLGLPGLTVDDFFNLSVAYAPATGAPASERFPLVSVNQNAGANRLDQVLAGQSMLLSWPFVANSTRPGDGATGTAAEGLPSLPLTLADYLGDQGARTGIYALETVDLFNLMSIPPDQPDSPTGTPPRMSLYPVAAKYCMDRRAFLVIDPPEQWSTYWTQGKTASIKIGDLGSYGPEGTNAAVYFPNLANFGTPATFRSPSGAIAGIMARTDLVRGVWKAPAGITDGPISGIPGLELTMTDAQNGMLNPQGINALRTFPASGSVVWGARTLKGADALSSDWKYIPVRRLALYIEESLYRGTQWAVFEPNDEPLWAALRLNVGAFMNGLFRQGAFQGKSASDAYYVNCDASTTTQNDINLGIVNVNVGFAPLKPAEFVIISIAQIAGKIQT